MLQGVDTKLIGGMFLLAGTAIGGGMLALPITNGPAGFIDSTLFLFLIWLAMTLGALLILEVNLYFPTGSNIISMIKNTLGKSGELIAWLSYLFLIYALLAAYIAAGMDILSSLLALIRVFIPQWLSAFMLTGMMVGIVYKGIVLADLVNRCLIFSKFIVYFILILLTAPYISLENLQGGEAKYITGSLMVLVTAFGFALIVPSLRCYLNDDVKKLRQAIIIGSLFPLAFYMVWNAIIIGVIPKSGELGLIALLGSANPNSGLATVIQQLLNQQMITIFYRFFMSVCILTSFIGVSLCLFDFWADGLHVPKRGWYKAGLLALTFMPPLAIALFYPRAFIMALSYAGIACVVLLLLIPALMAWQGRYVKHLAVKYQLFGGKSILIAVIIAALVLMVVGVGEKFW